MFFLLFLQGWFYCFCSKNVKQYDLISRFYYAFPRWYAVPYIVLQQLFESSNINRSLKIKSKRIFMCLCKIKFQKMIFDQQSTEQVYWTLHWIFSFFWWSIKDGHIALLSMNFSRFIINHNSYLTKYSHQLCIYI